MNNSLPLGETLTRKELQWYMKQWGLPANTKTKKMLEEYESIRLTSCDLEGDARAPPIGQPPKKEAPPVTKPSPVASTAAVLAAQSPEAKKPAPVSKPSPAAGAVASKPSPAASAAASSKPSPKKKSAQEKRLKPFRPTCSQATKQRIQRALSQRLYLVKRGEVSPSSHECDFVVLGSTGNVYTVRIGHVPSCSCPDSAKGHHCKHTLFVLLKVIGLDRDSPYIYQAALLTSELEEIFATAAERAARVGGVMASARVQQAYASLSKGESPAAEEDETGGVRRKSLDPESSDCPICFDAMDSGSSSITFCRAMCGTNFHEDCIRRWCQQHRANPTCPACRQPWQDSATSAAAASTKEGYTNFGQMQGQSSTRDTSTYSEWFNSPYAKRRRNYW